MDQPMPGPFPFPNLRKGPGIEVDTYKVNNPRMPRDGESGISNDSCNISSPALHTLLPINNCNIILYFLKNMLACQFG